MKPEQCPVWSLKFFTQRFCCSCFLDTIHCVVQLSRISNLNSHISMTCFVVKAIWPSSLHFHPTQASQISLSTQGKVPDDWTWKKKTGKISFELMRKNSATKISMFEGLSCCILNPTEKQVSSWVPIENFLLQMWSLLFNKSWIEELRAKTDDKVGIKRFLHIWELNQKV